MFGFAIEFRKKNWVNMHVKRETSTHAKSAVECVFPKNI